MSFSDHTGEMGARIAARLPAVRIPRVLGIRTAATGLLLIAIYGGMANSAMFLAGLGRLRR